jgi:hypothetical protein
VRQKERDPFETETVALLFIGRGAPGSPESCGVRRVELFRYSSSIYGGSDTLIGASWDLLPWFVGAGAAFIIAHALVKTLAGRRHADEPR